MADKPHASKDPSTRLIQVEQLYEFALAVGSSSNLLDNCQHFFEKVVTRRNLSYAALWLQHPLGQADATCALTYSDPKSEYSGPQQMPANSSLWLAIREQGLLSIDRKKLLAQPWNETDYLPRGDSFTFVHLHNLGFIVFAGHARHGRWPSSRLHEMRPIFDNFATSIRSSIHFEQLQVEIIERKNAERKATQASEVKGQFLANMSHELRTPLNAVLGMSQLLEETALDGEQKELVEIIQTSSHTLLNLINDILDFSKLEAHKVVLDTSHFDLFQLIKIIDRTFRKSCEQKGLHFDIQVDENLPAWLIGDAMRIKQILLNLMSNAIKFTEQGEIDLLVRLDSMEDDRVVVQFCVSDTGIGIAAKHLDGLFDSFFQVDASITRKFGGTGLGLSICKQLAELMHGRIEVDSQPGQGSTFCLTLPLRVSSEIRNGQDNKTDDTAANDTKPTHILLVEDDHFNQLVAQKLLLKLGYRCDIAHNGQQAIDALRQRQYDLVFMDMEMPTMDGIEATQRIRNSTGKTLNPDVVIIAMTANVMEADRHLCLRVGMNDFLNKPFSKNELAEKIDIWLGQDTNESY